MPPPPTPANRDTILQLAAQYRLPAIYADTHFAAEGGLMVTDQTPPIYFGVLRPMLTAFSAAPR